MNGNHGSGGHENGGFWATLPGILTGLAGLTGAITGLIIGLKEAGLVGQNSALSPTVISSVNSSLGSSRVISPEKSSVPILSSPSSPQPLLQSEPSPLSRWEFMGSASTGEGIYVDSNSIKKLDQLLNFTYKIGNELVNASADCPNNRWYANDYTWYSPQSKATQDMLNYVCKF